MSDTDPVSILLGLAQIAAAFAGFAALVSVLRERGEHAEAIHDILRLRVVISTSVLVIAASLVPIALLQFGIDGYWLWAGSGVLMFLMNLGIVFSFMGSYKPVQGQFDPDSLAVGVTGAMELAEWGLLATLILNLMPDERFPLYLTALIINIGQAAFVFIRYVGSEFRVSHPG